MKTYPDITGNYAVVDERFCGAWSSFENVTNLSLCVQCNQPLAPDRAAPLSGLKEKVEICNGERNKTAFCFRFKKKFSSVQFSSEIFTVLVENEFNGIHCRCFEPYEVAVRFRKVSLSRLSFLSVSVPDVYFYPHNNGKNDQSSYSKHRELWLRSKWEVFLLDFTSLGRRQSEAKKVTVSHNIWTLCQCLTFNLTYSRMNGEFL